MQDLAQRASVTMDQALAQTNHHLLWRATLRDGSVILEQPGLSSDHLPRDEVVSMDYVPVRRKDWPIIQCSVDVDKGERFIRKWTTLWHQGQGQARIYVAGIQRGDQFAYIGVYPHMQCKLVFGCKSLFTPPWIPEPFKLLPPEVQMRGGPGNAAVGWTYEGFGGIVVRYADRLIFSSLYP